MSDRSLPGVHEKPGGGMPKWVALLIAGAGFLIVLVIMVSAFSGSRSSSSEAAAGGPADSDASAYAQTWERPYSETTCSDWSSRMTEKQRFAAAADILASAWGKIEKSDRFPPDSLIRQFQGGITTSCAADSYTLTDITYLLYNSEPVFHP